MLLEPHNRSRVSKRGKKKTDITSSDNTVETYCKLVLKRWGANCNVNTLSVVKLFSATFQANHRTILEFQRLLILTSSKKTKNKKQNTDFHWHWVELFHSVKLQNVCVFWSMCCCFYTLIIYSGSCWWHNMSRTEMFLIPDLLSLCETPEWLYELVEHLRWVIPEHLTTKRFAALTRKCVNFWKEHLLSVTRHIEKQKPTTP